MNTFMNLVKRFSIREETKGGVEAFKGVEALEKASLLPTLDFLAGL